MQTLLCHEGQKRCPGCPLQKGRMETKRPQASSWKHSATRRVVRQGGRYVVCMSLCKPLDTNQGTRWVGGYLMLIRRAQSSACRVGVLSSRRHRILRPKIGPDHRRDRLVIAVGIATVRRPAVVMVVFFSSAWHSEDRTRCRAFARRPDRGAIQESRHDCNCGSDLVGQRGRDEAFWDHLESCSYHHCRKMNVQQASCASPTD